MHIDGWHLIIGSGTTADDRQTPGTSCVTNPHNKVG
jgi:hypothetical protein